jgi:hypothetical protein
LQGRAFSSDSDGDGPSDSVSLMVQAMTICLERQIITSDVIGHRWVTLTHKLCEEIHFSTQDLIYAQKLEQLELQVDELQHRGVAALIHINSIADTFDSALYESRADRRRTYDDWLFKVREQSSEHLLLWLSGIKVVSWTISYRAVRVGDAERPGPTPLNLARMRLIEGHDWNVILRGNADF